MNVFLTQEERISAVLENALPADILTDDDMDVLFRQLSEAILRKTEKDFKGSSVGDSVH
jgi:hypothetical protein